MIKPGDFVRALLPGARQTKRRPAIVVSTDNYHPARPDVLLAIITSRVEDATTEFDCVLFDWEDANLQLPSAMRSYLFTVEVAGVTKLVTLSAADWSEVQSRLRLTLEV